MRDDFDDEEVDGASPARLADLIEEQRTTLISVATGGPRIDDREYDYKKRHRLLKAGLERYELSPPFKWSSLWDWYGYYSAKLGSYASRRSYINQLADPVLEQLTRLENSAGGVADWGSAQETWPTLNGRLEESRSRVATASSLDDFQDVGRRAREIVIAGVNLVFDASMVPKGDDVPKGSDAKNRLEHIMNALVPGTAHAELRKLMRGALELGHKVTHSEGISRIDAFAAAQATVLVVRTLSEMQQERTTALPGMP